MKGGTAPVTKTRAEGQVGWDSGVRARVLPQHRSARAQLLVHKCTRTSHEHAAARPTWHVDSIASVVDTWDWHVLFMARRRWLFLMSSV